MLVRKSSIVVAGLFALAILGYAALPARPALGQAQREPGVGRYQLALGGGSPAACVVIDTATSHAWIYQAGGWQDLGTPAKAEK